MSENCDVIAIFRIYRRIGAIWKADSKRIVCKTYILINSNFLSYKNWKQNLDICNTVLTLLLWVKVLLWPKKPSFFAKKNADISKIKGRALALKGVFPKTTFGVLDQVLGGWGYFYLYRSWLT